MKSGQFKDMSRSERLLEAAEMVAEVVAVHGVPRVADDHLTALALGETPEDDVLAQRTSGGFHVSVTVTRNISPATAVVHVDGAAGAFHPCFLTVEPGHFILVSLESLWDGHP